MNKKKIVHVIPNMGTGGAEKLVLDICKFLDKNIFEVKIISLYNSSDSIYEQIAKENDIEIIFLDKKPGPDFKVILKLISIFKEISVDVAHTHLYVMPYVLPALILANVKLRIHTVHNIASKEVTATIKKIMKICYKYLGVIPVGISDYISKTISEEYKLELSKIPCIYNGIDIEKFKNCKGESGTNVNFVHVGRFTEQKNHELLLEAFSIALKKNKNLKLNLVGDGILKSEIESNALKNNLEKNILFRGIQSDINKELNKADIFVLSSKWEGLPLSILEGMACGLPIITTNVGGVSDIVKNNINGILVENNSKSLSEAMIKLSEDKTMRQEMGMQSRVLVKQYDIRNTVAKYEKLYQIKL